MYNSERINDQSYKDIQSLLYKSFGMKFSESSIRKKYDTSMFGLKNVGLIGRDEKKDLAAFYGVFPIVLEYDSSDYLIAQSGETMTAPEHRKKGLFTRLAKETYLLCEEIGVKGIYGFPNENSYPGFKSKLDWVFPSFLQKFTIENLTFPGCELTSKLKSLRPLYNWYYQLRIKSYLVDLKSLEDGVFTFSNTKGRIKRDTNFFKYKLSGENTSIVNVSGFKMLVKASSHLYIGEVAKIEKGQTKELIKEIKKLSRVLGCKKAIFLLSENHWLYDYLKEKITPTKSQPIGFYVIDEKINPDDIQFSVADFDTF